MNKSQGKLGKNRMGSMKDRVVLLFVPALFLLGFYAGRREGSENCEVYVYDRMELVVITCTVYVEPLEEFPLTQKEALKGKGEETLPHPPGSRADHDIGIEVKEPPDIHRLIDVYRSPLPDTLKIEA